MRRRFVLLLALVFVIPLAWLPAQQRPRRGENQRGMRRGDQAAGEHGWIFNLEEGKAQARKSGKPLMVMVRCVP